jgi:RNA recognition motif-containing protein
METIFVGNLSYFCSEGVLRNIFKPYGTVNSTIIRKTKANQTLYYGFVQMKSSQEASLAVSNLDGCMVQGRRMK